MVALRTTGACFVALAMSCCSSAELDKVEKGERGGESAQNDPTTAGASSAGTSSSGSAVKGGATGNGGSAGRADPGGAPATTCETALGYQDCIADANVCRAGVEPVCLVDDLSEPTSGVCSASCDTPCDCPRAPARGTAQVECLAVGNAGRKYCVLVCANGEACPPGMSCQNGACEFDAPPTGNPYASCDECPTDTLLCLEDPGQDSVCARACSRVDECPDGLDGDAQPDCIGVRGQGNVCLLLCNQTTTCPTGMVCINAGVCAWAESCQNVICSSRETCVENGGVAACVCEPGLVEDPELGCVSPCAGRKCQANASCRVEADAAVCACNDGYVDDGSGKCINPCASESCKEHAHCELTASGTTCVCDNGYADDGGVCRDATPCNPNPCQGTTPTCVANGFDYSCDCADPVLDPPLCLPDCPGQHFDGDAFEPNECAAQARAARVTEAGSPLDITSVDISPPETDVDWWKVTPASGTYWLLLDATAAMCTPSSPALPVARAFENFDYGAQLAASGLTAAWSCSRRPTQVANPTYSFSIVHFPTGGDLPTVPAAQPVTARFIADTFASPTDVDAFTATVDLPARLTLTGQHAFVMVEVRDAETKDLLASMQQECAFSLTPASCVSVSGSGRVQLEVTVQESAAPEQTTLRAWRMDF